MVIVPSLHTVATLQGNSQTISFFTLLRTFCILSILYDGIEKNTTQDDLPVQLCVGRATFNLKYLLYMLNNYGNSNLV